MERVFLGLAGIAAVILFSAARELPSDESDGSRATVEPAPRTLWVTLEAGGEVYRAAVKPGEAAAYVRSYVAGREPVAVPDRFLTEWLRSTAVRAPGASARIMRAEECSPNGPCERLRGFYAGRSPDQT